MISKHAQSEFGNDYLMHTGLVATTDALIRVSDTTLALVTSFVSLKTTLTTITIQLANLVSNCTTNAADTAVCSMIPSPDTIGTDANFSAVSGCNANRSSILLL